MPRVLLDKERRKKKKCSLLSFTQMKGKKKKEINKGKWSIIGQKKMKDGRTSLGTRGGQ